MIEIIYFIPILLSAYVIGFSIFKLFRLETNKPEESIFSIVFGFAFYSYLTFFLGILGLLYALAFWIVILLSLILGFNLWFSFLKNIFKKIQNFKLKYNLEAFLITVILIFSFLALLSTLVPPFLWDELDYQLSIPKAYVRHHAIISNYSSWASELPYQTNMLFVMGLLLKNAILAKFFSLSNGLLLAVAIYSFANRFYNKKIGLLATSIYLTLPMVMNHIGSAYVDISTALYIFLAFYCYLVWDEQKKASWLFFSAVFTGFSIASKINAVFPAIIIGFFVIYGSIKNYNVYTALKKIIFFGVIVLLLLSPWFTKSYINTLNPIWPLANNMFGGKYWDTEINTQFTIGTILSKSELVKDLILLPWEITMNSSKYHLLLGWDSLFLAFVPLLAFFRKIDKITKYILLHSIIFLYVMIIAEIYVFGFRLMRYVMIYPALSIISGLVLLYLLKQKMFIKTIFILLSLTFLFTFLLWAGVYGNRIPYAYGAISEQDYYDKYVDNIGYAAFSYINKNLQVDSKVFFFRESRAYLIDRDYILGLPFYQKVIDYNRINNSNELYQQLKQNGITHILVNSKISIFQPQEFPIRKMPFSKEHQNFMEKLLKDHSILLFEDNGVYVYEIK